MLISPTLICSLPLFALTLGLTLPPDLLRLHSRSQQHCANAPATIAGSMLSSRNPSTTALDLRTPLAGNTIVWCQHGSRTFINVEMIHLVGDRAAAFDYRDLLTACLNIIAYEIETSHDGPIDEGVFERVSQVSTLTLQAWNDNNHQITYGVLGSAVSALLDLMQLQGWGACVFRIFDGPTQVGLGELG